MFDPVPLGFTVMTGFRLNVIFCMSRRCSFNFLLGFLPLRPIAESSIRALVRTVAISGSNASLKFRRGFLLEYFARSVCLYCICDLVRYAIELSHSLFDDVSAADMCARVGCFCKLVYAITSDMDGGDVLV